MNIQQLLNEALLKEQEESLKRERSGCFTPSSFGQCYRRQIWKRKNEPITNPIDERGLRIFKMGHTIHKAIYDLLPEGTRFEVEVTCSDDIKGFADIVTPEMVIDLKSVHSRKFWHMGRKKDEDEQSAAERFRREQYDNIIQVMSYCLFLDRPIGKLVYISRDDWCINEYQFKLEDWKDDINNELIILRKWWEKGLPPARPRLYLQKDGSFKECQYCPFKDLCEKTEKESK